MTSDFVPQLRLRALEPEDFSWLSELENSIDAAAYSCNIAPISAHLMREYALNYDADPFQAGQLRLIAETLNPCSPVAVIDLYNIDAYNRHAFVGIITLPQHRRKGFARQSLNLLADYCLNSLGMPVIYAVVDDYNTPSIKLFKSSGFRQLCSLPLYHRSGITFRDSILLAKTLI